MGVCIVRHAKAIKQAKWDAPDRLRPLTPRGLRQSRALVGAVADRPLTRLISSPHLRCVQTLEPLAAATGLPIELDDRIADGRRPEAALKLLEEVSADSVALCTHGGLITGLLSELEDRGARLEIEGRFRCQKGSIWEVLPRGGKPRRVVYRSPRLQPKKKRTMPDRERIAVLDLGSTSFRVVVFEATRAGQLVPILNERTMLRLGAAIGEDGSIPKPACEAAVAAATRIARIAREADVDRILPVATAALREAANGPDLTSRIGESIGEAVRVVSGEEEAELFFRAVQRRVVIDREPALGLDLGGGSLDLAIGDAHEIRWAASLPIGVARLHRQIVEHDPMRKREVRRVRDRLLEALDPIRAEIEALGPRTFVAGGGTARAFGSFEHARRGGAPETLRGPVELTRRRVEKLTRRLVRADQDERCAILGARRDRADLLPTGGILLATLAEVLEIESYSVCDWGLREGVVLEALSTL